MPDARSSTTTVIAISAVAYALADMVHEALGHGLLSLLVPGVKLISISTVALSSTGSSRIVAAAGMIANIIAGSVSLWLFANRRQFTPGSYFLWLFAGVNLMNIGYLLYSGVLRSGDWSEVIAGVPMEPLWRVALIAAGIAGYIGVMRLLYAAMASPGQTIVARWSRHPTRHHRLVCRRNRPHPPRRGIQSDQAIDLALGPRRRIRQHVWLRPRRSMDRAHRTARNNATGSPLQRDVDHLRRDHRRGVCTDTRSGTSFVGFLT